MEWTGYKERLTVKLIEERFQEVLKDEEPNSGAKNNSFSYGEQLKSWVDLRSSSYENLVQINVFLTKKCSEVWNSDP